MDRKVKAQLFLASIAMHGIRLNQSKIPKNQSKNCVQCGIEIPPGRDGRKCKECRELQTRLQQNINSFNDLRKIIEDSEFVIEEIYVHDEFLIKRKE